MQTKTALAVAGPCSPCRAPPWPPPITPIPPTRGAAPLRQLTHDDALKDRLVRTNVRLARREAR